MNETEESIGLEGNETHFSGEPSESGGQWEFAIEGIALLQGKNNIKICLLFQQHIWAEYNTCNSNTHS